MSWNKQSMKNIATFSIVARDDQTQELAIAVQSKFLAVGSAVCFGKANVGAIATQAMANLDFGSIGLQLLEKGYSAIQVENALKQLDPEIEHRQFGIVSANGDAISFTGSKCFDFAGGYAEQNLACQGNILVSKDTIDAMVHAFKNTSGTLAFRCVKALDAAQQAGGDKRGRQSAALLVLKENGSYGGYNDRAIDLRVDDDPQPIEKLSHLLALHEMYFEKTKEEDKVELNESLIKDIQQALLQLNYYHGELSGQFDSNTQQAFVAFCGWENFEERVLPYPFVDKNVIDFLIKNATSH